MFVPSGLCPMAPLFPALGEVWPCPIDEFEPEELPELEGDVCAIAVATKNASTVANDKPRFLIFSPSRNF
jgi:hypothetical protein